LSSLKRNPARIMRRQVSRRFERTERTAISDSRSTTATWFRRRVSRWADTNGRSFPWRSEASAFQILVAEILLQQTDAKRVEPVYRELLNRYPTIDALAVADRNDLEELIRPLGFHFRAKTLTDAAIILGPLIRKGLVPNEELLLRIRGLGPYTARSILVNAYGRRLAVIDTNIARILWRFFGEEPTTARPRNDPRLWQLASVLVATRKEASSWNLALIDFGAQVCTATRPKCAICPLRTRCHYLSLMSNMPIPAEPGE
jgi:A/G-specific adenine glycosylase